MEFFYAVTELTDPHSDRGWPRLVNAFFTAIFQYGTVKVAHLVLRYDSLGSLQQRSTETEQAFIHCVIRESMAFPFVEKDRETLINASSEECQPTCRRSWEFLKKSLQ